MRWKQVKLSNDSETLNKIKEEVKIKNKRLRRQKRRAFIFKSFLLLFFILMLFLFYQYDQSSRSRVDKVLVKGNHFYSEEFIKKKADLQEGDRYYLKNQRIIKNKLEKLDIVDQVLVKRDLSNKIFFLNILEKRVILQDDEFLYFQEGLILPREELMLDHLNAPFLDQVDQDVVPELIEVISDIESSVFLSISEIKQLQDSSEKEFVLTMNEGYYVFSSLNTLSLMDNYATIISGTEEENRCIYILEHGPSDDTHVATAKPCD